MALPEWAAQYIGIPFHTGGDTSTGLNCWELFCKVLREQYDIEADIYEQFNCSSPANYRHAARRITTECRKFPWVEVISKDDWPGGLVNCGDGILMRIKGSPAHVGIALDNQWMIHTEKGISSCLGNPRSAGWTNRVLGVFRHAGLN